MNKFVSLFKDENGATAIEYALIAALIGIAIIASSRTVGTSIASQFNNVGAQVAR